MAGIHSPALVDEMNADLRNSVWGMDLVYELDAGVARLDLAMRQLTAISLDWEGAAASSARLQIRQLAGQVYVAQAQLSQARDELVAARAQFVEQVKRALLGVG
ncbi:MAG: hypothetical protein Q4D87_04505 [Actinomycetaceae bacterium]|nr:hypothetical protein [Actinomycetaceae bacterium]